MKLTTSGVSKLIGVCQSTVGRWVKLNKIPYEPKTNNWTYFNYKKIIEWLNTKEIPMRKKETNKEVNT